MSDELYECAGCAGEVPIFEAVWFPEDVGLKKARPYCSLACFETHQPKEQPLEFVICDTCDMYNLCGGCRFNEMMAKRAGIPFKILPTEIGYING